MSDKTLSPVEVAESIWGYYAGPPPAAPNPDDMEALAKQFVELKQHLGHRYHLNGDYLRRWIRFMQDRGICRGEELSVQAMLAWAASRAHIQPTTWAREVNALSVFMDHLKVLGKITNNLCLFLKRRHTSNFRPYIFTVDELRKIFTLAEADGPAGDRGLIYFLIYGCGLRVAEAAHLRIQDFDVERGTIFIEKSKFGKDRLLPVHPRILERLRSYRDQRRADAPAGSWLFLNPAGRGHRPNCLSYHFRQDLTHLGLYRPTRDVDGIRYGSPRAHALRHSFATHRLLRWYREGADVQAKLPLLSTYMGHSDVRHTQVYLTITGLILREAQNRFTARWESQFPLQP
jgi:integrase